MRLTSTTANRLIMQYDAVQSSQIRTWQKEPFTLADESLGLPALAILDADAQYFLHAAHTWRFQCFLGRPYAGSIARHCCHEPSPLVVPAQETLTTNLALIVLRLGKEQQVPILSINV